MLFTHNVAGYINYFLTIFTGMLTILWVESLWVDKKTEQLQFGDFLEK